jgi:putative flavoprotein involved in K+ transport
MTAGGERVETLIVGAGQAGLAVGHHLAKRGRSFLILDANGRVGDNWRRHYDSLRRYSPARLDRLPGMPFPAPAWSFPTKDEMADYLERYAARFELPVRTGARVDRISQNGHGYVVDCGERRLEADNVVVATGTFGRPFTPPFAGELGPGIVQLHSSEYKNPSQLADGHVLVVGAAHSGADVAMDVAPTHRTILWRRDTGQFPGDIESRPGRPVWLAWSLITRRVLTLRTPIGRRMRPEVRGHGEPLLRFKRADLDAAGVHRTTARTAGASDGKPRLDDGTVVDVANVVWCTGFRQDFGWIEPPVTGEDGWPVEERGVVHSAPGLYFAGLAFQSAFSSMLVLGAGRDAKHVARHIAARADRRPARVAP